MKLKHKIKIIQRNKIADSRGWFLKIITGKEEHIPLHTGEVYMVNAKPGESRANHYHLQANEWFTLVAGKALMLVEDVSTKERMSIELDSDNPRTIYVPNQIAHSFENISSEPYLLVTYSDRLYDPADTIIYKLS
jgi:dTDP-4-dehydrorhamnose 3,5-epimerase-like enzyme